MNTSLILMGKLASLMIIAAVGFIVVRTGVLKESDKRQLATLTLFVLQPSLIILAFQIDLTPERIRGYLTAVAFTGIVQLGFIGACGVLRRMGLVGVVEELSIIYVNCGNLILPIVSMTMGAEMTFYASAFPLTFNILFWTHGVSCMEGNRHIDWKKILLNSNVIAVFIGVFLLLTRIPIPGVVKTSMQMMADMVGPGAMLVVGMTLAGSNIRAVVTCRKAYLVAFLRLLVFPFLTMGILWATGFLARHPEFAPILRVCFLAAAAPPASNVSQLAVLYDREPVSAGIYNLLGMFFCVLTMPLVDYVYAMAFGV
ncbi:MAG: AEC family transporter [Eubacteriales bacterium]|nr:AEC family transporter [Eubacteriales bacterium]